MKLGRSCPGCGADHWIGARKDPARSPNKIRCGVCFPPKAWSKSMWPRIVRVRHAVYSNHSSAHTITIGDVELSRAIGVRVDKLDCDGGNFSYRIQPIYRSDFKTLDDAKVHLERSRARGRPKEAIV